MRFFENKLSLLILLFTLPLLFLPKINLIGVQSETAGVRIDDFVLLLIGGLFMLAHALSHQRLYKVEGWMLILTGFGIFSFLCNRFLLEYEYLYMDAKILYAIRLLEYFLFFYIGALASYHVRSSTVIRLLFLWNLLFMTLQKLNLAGAMTVLGYNTDASSRVYGIASFPSEMGLLLNLMFCHMIFDDTSRSRFVNLFASPIVRDFCRKFYLYGLFGLFGIFVVFTGNRISILALFLCFIYRLKQEFSWRSVSSILLMLCLIPVLLNGVFILITKTAAIYERSAGLFSFKNLELATIVWDKIDMKTNPIGNEVISAEQYDASWWMRIHKWIYVLKAYVETPACYLQGLGPGFAWAALDGGLLRILMEYGLIGAFIFWKFFACLARINQQTKWMMIAFLINMIFFDAYLAYKTMSVLLFTCGHAFERKHRALRVQETPLPSFPCTLTTLPN